MIEQSTSKPAGLGSSETQTNDSLPNATQATEVVDPLSKVIPSPVVNVTCRDDSPSYLNGINAGDSVLSPKVAVHEGRANLAGADLSGMIQWR